MRAAPFGSPLDPERAPREAPGWSPGREQEGAGGVVAGGHGTWSGRFSRTTPRRPGETAGGRWNGPGTRRHRSPHPRRRPTPGPGPGRRQTSRGRPLVRMEARAAWSPSRAAVASDSEGGHWEESADAISAHGIALSLQDRVIWKRRRLFRYRCRSRLSAGNRVILPRHHRCREQGSSVRPGNGIRGSAPRPSPLPQPLR